MAVGEQEIRTTLEGRLATMYRRRDGPPLIVGELGLYGGRVRADVVSVGQRMSGYEIKSDQDNLARLRDQERAYSDVFDTATIVTTARHLDGALGWLPSWWGAVRVRRDPLTGRAELNAVRPARPNPQVKPTAIVQLLWRDEALSALRRLGLAKGLVSKPRRCLWEKLVSALTIDELRQVVRVRLTERQGWRAGM